MTSLTVRLEHYIAVRRSLGYDLSFAERVLRRFTAFADGEGADHITVDLFLRWKKHFGSANNNTWSARLGMVRVFASWLQGFDSRTEVPPPGLIAGKSRRTRPYIYTEDQIAGIVREATRLSSGYGLRGWTCSTLFGLIAVTGLRVNEALGLDDDDVDLDQAVLTVKRGKNGKSRLIPIVGMRGRALRAYRAERNRLLGASPAAFFRFESGNARPTAARATTSRWCASASACASRSPSTNMAAVRVSTICAIPSRCARSWTGIGAGLDPDREMLKLSTYLGHIDARAHLLVHRGDSGTAAARLRTR